MHNQYIVDALSNLNIKTIDQKGKTRMELLDEIDEGVVIITAHGASKEVFQKARDKGLTVVDATCRDVTRTHDLIRDAIDRNRQVLYIGKKGHPEAEGAIAISDHAHLIEKIEDLDSFPADMPYTITNQTTMSMWDIQAICDKAKTMFDDLEICKETCNATTIRQQAVKDLPDDLEVLYVVGDPHSNNSTRLGQIAKQFHPIEVYMIESVQDIHIEQLMNKHYVGVTSGASTPTCLTNQVISYLEQFNADNPDTYNKPEIDFGHIL